MSMIIQGATTVGRRASVTQVLYVLALPLFGVLDKQAIRQGLSVHRPQNCRARGCLILGGPRPEPRANGIFISHASARPRSQSKCMTSKTRSRDGGDEDTNAKLLNKDTIHQGLTFKHPP